MNSTEQPAVGAPVEPTVMQHTPGPWSVRKQERLGELRDCFVTAADVSGCAYDAEILGDDEYTRDETMARKLADCNLIAAAPDLLMALRMLYDEMADYMRLNNLGGMDNQCMQLARAALARVGVA